MSLKEAVIDQQYVSRLLTSLVVDEGRMKAFCSVIVQEVRSAANCCAVGLKCLIPV